MRIVRWLRNHPVVTWVSAFLSVAIALSLLVVNYRSHHETKRSPIVIATFSKAIGNSPYHIAKHFGWFDEQPELKGRKIEFKEFNDRTTISDAFTAGDLQVLFCAEVPSLLCRIQGNDIRIVDLSTKVEQSILVPTGSPIRGPKDLRGKKVAVLQGTSSHYCLLKILAANGIAERDLDLRYMAANEAKVAFEGGQIDAWAVWAPFVEQQEVAGRGKALSGGDAYINSVMSVAHPLISDEPAVVKALVKTIERAKTWMRKNPEQAIEIVARDLGLDVAVVRQAWPKHDWAAMLNPAAITDFQGKADFLAKGDKTRQGKSIDVAKDAVDLSFLQE